MGPSTELIMSWLHITFSHAFSTWSPGGFSMTIILLWPWIWCYLTSWPRCHELQIYKYFPSDCGDLQCVHGGRKHFCLQSSSWYFGPESGQRWSGLIDYDNRIWWGRNKSAKRWHKKRGRQNWFRGKELELSSVLFFRMLAKMGRSASWKHSGSIKERWFPH